VKRRAQRQIELIVLMRVLFGEAELDTAQSMVEAIKAARAELDVRKMYPVSVLRALA
jgi:hypothetical protein